MKFISKHNRLKVSLDFGNRNVKADGHETEFKTEVWTRVLKLGVDSI